MSSRKMWIDQATQIAAVRVSTMSDKEQNEFWLKHSRIFLPFSSIVQLQEFCGKTSVYPEPDPDQCLECDGQNLVSDERHNDIICSDCGIIQPGPVPKFKNRLQSGQAYISKRGYYPEDHMSAILIEMQCGRSRDVSDLIQDCGDHLKQHDKPVTFLNVRSCLRRLGYKQHYLMLPSILHGLDRIQFRPWIVSPTLLRKIQGLFYQYKVCFDQLSSQNKEHRKNSLNYHFLLIQFFKLLDMTDIPWRFLRCPKGQSSLKQHQHIWDQIEHQLILYE